MERPTPRFMLLGRLTRDYILLPGGQPLLDVPGGSALYAGIGLSLWEPNPPPGIISRVGEDYPQSWLEEFERCGLDVRGVRILPEALDLRSFTAIIDHFNLSHDDPIAHFARHGLSFPKALLGYQQPPISAIDSRTQMSPFSLRKADIPAAYLEVSAAHLCPLDYLTHSLLPALLRQEQINTITLDPSPGYMNSAYWGDIPALLTGLTAFMPSEEELRALFQNRSNDLWEMAQALSAYGCEVIVIKCGERGQLLYDASTRTRWEIPPYASRFSNPIGTGDAFCGGFLAGYRRTYDPLESVLYGNISASLVVEGDLATYALEALPGLRLARLESLRQSVRKV
jgi:sugar/nucleoside kinase (ribokinase family)